MALKIGKILYATDLTKERRLRISICRRYGTRIARIIICTSNEQSTRSRPSYLRGLLDGGDGNGRSQTSRPK